MIKFCGDEKELVYSKKELQSFVEEANEKKNTYLKHFIEILDLDPELFSHLFKIDLVIDSTPEMNDGNQVAFFVQKDELLENNPSIHISSEYLEGLMMDMEDDHPDKKNMYYGMATITLIHETIHFNRSILVNGSVHLKETEVDAPEGTVNYRNTLNELESMLDKCYDPSKEIIVLKVIYDKNGYKTTVYNSVEDAYETYYFPMEFFKEFNPSDLMSNMDEIISIAYHDQTVLPIRQNRIHNIEPETYPGIVMHLDVENKDNLRFPMTNEEISYENKKINSQIGIEESISEVLAYVIYFSRKFDSVEEPKIYEITDENMDTYDYKLAAKMLSKWDKDMYKWFMLSCYQDHYEDRLAQTYGKDYDDLKTCFSYLYDSYPNENTIVQQTIYKSGLKLVQKK